MPDDTTGLLAVYDFSVSPTSFDFVAFLARAEMHRRRLGVEGSRTLFVLNRDGGFWDRESRSVAAHRSRLDKMLAPLCDLWGGAPHGETPVGRDRASEIIAAWQGPVFPRDYRLDAPISDCFQWAHLVAAHCVGETLPRWRAGPAERALIREFLGAERRPLAVVTVRETADGRVSDFAAWAWLAERLHQADCRTIFVRDTDFLESPVPRPLRGMTFCAPASSSPRVRAALYEEASLCLMHANGPMQLCWLGEKTRSMVFGIENPAFDHGRAIPIRSMGLNIGAPLPMHAGRHRLVWRPDDVATLRKMFPTILAVLQDPDLPVETAPVEPPIAIARQLRKTHRLEAAARIYHHLANQSGPESSGGRAGLALCADAESGVPRLARKARFAAHYARLIQTSPSACDGEALAEVSVAHMRARRYGRAVVFARACIADERVSASARSAAHGVLARCALAKGQLDAAKTQLLLATEADPRDPVPLVEMARLMEQQGDTDGAEDCLARARQNDPSVGTTLGNRGGHRRASALQEA